MDGTIRIDTKIMAENFNKGIQKVVQSARTAMRAIGIILRIVAVVVGAIVASFVAMEKALDKTSAQYAGIQQLKTAFDALRGAFVGAFYALFTALQPYIISVVEWLTNLLNKAAEWVAAISGQATVMKYVGENTSTAADEAGRLADETARAGKAAKGALASFDQLDVLKQTEAAAAKVEKPEATGPVFEEIKIRQDVIDKTAELKETIKSWWDQFMDIGNVWSENFEQARLFIGNLLQGFIDNWTTLVWGAGVSWVGSQVVLIAQGFVIAWGQVKIAWANAVEWFTTQVLDPIVARFKASWEGIAQWARSTKEWIVSNWEDTPTWFRETVIDPIVKFFLDMWTGINTKAGEVFANIKSVWTNVSGWFTENVINPIQKAFGPALDWLRDKWVTIFSGIRDFVKGIINGIIDMINSMIAAITDGLNGMIGNLNNFGSSIPGWVELPSVEAAKIPHLAKGAVIPPNSEFMAVLGDQTSGRNIEAPEGLIRQIVAEEIANMPAQRVTVEFTGSLAAFVRELHPLIKQETTRIGGSLIQSGSVS